MAAPDGLLRPAGARASAARGRARQDQSLRHRPRRRARHRPAPARARGHGALRPPARRHAATGWCSTTTSPSASTRPTRCRRASRRSIDDFIAKQSIAAPAGGPLQARLGAVPRTRELDYRAAGITSIVWCIGFRTDYSWLDLPVFNGRGQPSHVRGVTPLPGVYFLGLPWLYTWGSGRFSGVSRDAAYLAEHIEARVGLDACAQATSRAQRSRDRILDMNIPLGILEIDRILGGGPAMPAVSDTRRARHAASLPRRPVGDVAPQGMRPSPLVSAGACGRPRGAGLSRCCGRASLRCLRCRHRARCAVRCGART